VQLRQVQGWIFMFESLGLIGREFFAPSSHALLHYTSALLFLVNFPYGDPEVHGLFAASVPVTNPGHAVIIDSIK
jgi:hypothetical protein